MSEELIEIAEIESNTEENAEATEQTPERAIVFEEALEAILFAAGHPVSYATLARVFDITPSKIKDMVANYSMKYNSKSDLDRGVILLTYSDSCQLCTKELYLPEIRDALGIRKSGSLSTAAMETLAVVAYNQPVTRVFVDTIRKVDSSYAMNSLIDRGLIECVGRLDVPGRPMQYGTTSDFLRCFGLNSIAELPTASEDLINMFEKANAEQTIAAEDAQISINDALADAESEVAKEANEENVENLQAKSEAENEKVPSSNDDEPSAEDDIIDVD